LDPSQQVPVALDLPTVEAFVCNRDFIGCDKISPDCDILNIDLVIKGSRKKKSSGCDLLNRDITIVIYFSKEI
jgi:hypothetical protein